jgi:flagellar M-ring protein FliF
MRTEYQVLFSDLQPQDAANIVGELDRMKVPYKVAENDSKILIEESKVHETRLKLMGKGVSLNGTVGFEIFDKSDYGMTEYAQKINYQRALQGELARTISSIKEVKFARVHLVMPESSIFKQNKSQPKASISLVLKNETPLMPDQIRGIQGLVAAAVPNLDPSEVSILDQRGVILSQGSTKDGSLSALNGQLTVKKDVEGYLTRKAIEVLDRAFGPGQAIVSVDATLNLDAVKSTEESIVPAVINAEGAVGAIHRKRTTVQQQPFSDVKTAEQTVAYSGGATRAQSSTSEIEYTLGRKVEQIVTTPGSISRLSISVLVPYDMEEDRLAKVRDIVAMAVGMNPKRGDAIAVHSAHQFLLASNQENAAKAAAEQRGEDKSAQGRSKAASAGSVASQDYMAMLWVVVVVFVLMAIALGFRRWPAFSNSGRKSAHQTELTLQQREELLAQIRDWIGLNGKPVDGKAKP